MVCSAKSKRSAIEILSLRIHANLRYPTDGALAEPGDVDGHRKADGGHGAGT